MTDLSFKHITHSLGSAWIQRPRIPMLNLLQVLPFSLHLTLGDSSSPFVADQPSAPIEWPLESSSQHNEQVAELKPHSRCGFQPDILCSLTVAPSSEEMVQSSSEAPAQHSQCILLPEQPSLMQINAMPEDMLVNNLSGGAGLSALAAKQTDLVSLQADLESTVASDNFQQQGEHVSPMSDDSEHRVSVESASPMDAEPPQSSAEQSAKPGHHPAAATASATGQAGNAISGVYPASESMPDTLLVEDVQSPQAQAPGELIPDAELAESISPSQKHLSSDANCQPAVATTVIQGLIQQEAAAAPSTAAAAVPQAHALLAPVSVGTRQVPFCGHSQLASDVLEAAIAAGQAQSGASDPVVAVTTLPMPARRLEGAACESDDQEPCDEDVSGIPDTEEQTHAVDLASVEKRTEDVDSACLNTDTQVCQSQILGMQCFC